MNQGHAMKQWKSCWIRWMMACAHDEVKSTLGALMVCLWGGTCIAEDMIPGKVEERTEDDGKSTFGLLLARRETPVVLKGAARSWPGTEFLEASGVKSLTTRWRIHPLGPGIVWEADCHFTDASVGQFLEWERSDRLPVDGSNPFASFDRRTHWAYADYKHVAELAGDWGELLEPMIDWSSLGCDKVPADSTVWLGTGGCHTPLHFDTYGVNLVAQLHGKKRWLLYPPDDTANLYPTRVPYEESSVFSKVDARVPDLDRFPRLSETRPLSVTLERGDVLYVPKHWWHFVESEDTSLSVNVWIDAADDPKDRVTEALTRVLVTAFSERLAAEVGPRWLNPTEGDVWPLEETSQVADLAIQNCGVQVANGIGSESSFSTTALVDAISAPDVIAKVMEKVMLGMGRETSAPDAPPPPV